MADAPLEVTADYVGETITDDLSRLAGYVRSAFDPTHARNRKFTAERGEANIAWTENERVIASNATKVESLADLKSKVIQIYLPYHAVLHDTIISYKPCMMQKAFAYLASPTLG